MHIQPWNHHCASSYAHIASKQILTCSTSKNLLLSKHSKFNIIWCKRLGSYLCNDRVTLEFKVHFYNKQTVTRENAHMNKYVVIDHETPSLANDRQRLHKSNIWKGQAKGVSYKNSMSKSSHYNGEGQGGSIGIYFQSACNAFITGNGRYIKS